MNRATQPQLLKLQEVFDETVKGGTIQEELKSVILVKCVGGQLKSYLTLTIGDNVQYSTLRKQVLQWGPSQQKWSTSMVASSSTHYQAPMPMDVDRVQDAKGKGKKGKNDYQKGKGKDAKGKGKTAEGEQQKGKECGHKDKAKGKDQKGKGVTLVGSPEILLEIAGKVAHSSSGGASMATHTDGQQQANVSQ